MTKVLLALNLVTLALVAFLFIESAGHVDANHDHSEERARLVAEVLSEVDKTVSTKVNALNRSADDQVASVIQDDTNIQSLTESVVFPPDQTPEVDTVEDVELFEKHLLAAEQYKAKLASNHNSSISKNLSDKLESADE